MADHLVERVVVFGRDSSGTESCATAYHRVVEGCRVVEGSGWSRGGESVASSSVRASSTISASVLRCTLLNTQSKSFHVLSGIPSPCIQRLSISVLIRPALLLCSRAMAGMMIP